MASSEESDAVSETDLRQEIEVDGQREEAADREIPSGGSRPKLLCQPPSQLDAIPDVAVAIVGSPVTRNVEQRHLGLLLRDEDGTLALVHLGWHYDLSIDIPPSPEYSWLDVPFLNHVNAALFVDWCLTVAKENTDSVPYSMEYGGAPYFAEEDGHLQRTETGSGLTCATFVLEMFSGFQIKLIDIASWTIRTSDEPWTRKIVDFLTRTNGMSAAHLQSQQALIGKVARFRPEEVAAAATLHDGQPMSMQIAEAHGVDIVSQMAAANRL